MPAPLNAAMPKNADIGGNFSFVFDAVNTTTGATVPNVTVSQGTILAADLVPPGQPPGGGGGGSGGGGGGGGGSGPPPPPPPPPPSGHFWSWDVQSLAVHAQSAAWIASLLRTTPHAWVSAMQATATVTAHDLTKVYAVTNAGHGFDATFWIPNGTKPGISSDHHLNIIDLVTGRTHDIWEARDTNGDGKIDSFGGGQSYPTALTTAYPPHVAGGGTNAADVPSPPYNILPSEVAAGVCSHAIRFPYNKPSNAKPIYPAAPWAAPYPVSAGATPSNPPLGVLIRLPASSVLPAGAGPLERCVFNTLKVHGAVGTDGGSDITFKAVDIGGGGQGAPAWAAVGVTMSLTRAGILTDTTTQAAGGKLNRIPWNLLEVVALTPP